MKGPKPYQSEPDNIRQELKHDQCHGSFTLIPTPATCLTGLHRARLQLVRHKKFASALAGIGFRGLGV